MKIFRSILLMGCAIMALAAAAQQSDPVIASINEAYRQAKESIKKNKDMGNEMVTKLNRTHRARARQDHRNAPLLLQHRARYLLDYQ